MMQSLFNRVSSDTASRVRKSRADGYRRGILIPRGTLTYNLGDKGDYSFELLNQELDMFLVNVFKFHARIPEIMVKVSPGYFGYARMQRTVYEGFNSPKMLLNRIAIEDDVAIIGISAAYAVCREELS